MHKIKLLPIGEIKPNPRNARTHSKKQIRQIADSISAFGFLVPVLVDETSTTLGGHGRIEAAKLLGLERVPVIRSRGSARRKSAPCCLRTTRSPPMPDGIGRIWP